MSLQVNPEIQPDQEAQDQSGKRPNPSDLMTNTDSSMIVQTGVTVTDNRLYDTDWRQAEVTGSIHTLQKREAKWKAYGFDSSALQISDPWASRNMWFQQLTHSVRKASSKGCPCVVKIPSPSSWSDVFETVPEPFTIKCLSHALSWLKYKQEAARDYIMALSVNLFKPRDECAWMGNLPYVDLTDQYEKVTVPDSVEVKAVRARDCFCSNDTHGVDGMFMSISDCDVYMMQFDVQAGGAVNKVYWVTFRAPDHQQSRTLLVVNQTLPGDVTIGNFKDIWWVCGNKAYIFLPYGWTGCCYMATLKLPYDVTILEA